MLLLYTCRLVLGVPLVMFFFFFFDVGYTGGLAEFPLWEAEYQAGRL